ncbi:MAG: hypothetical protein WC483_02240, partial [Candidatus Paceibacterota bacterium]
MDQHDPRHAKSLHSSGVKRKAMPRRRPTSSTIAAASSVHHHREKYFFWEWRCRMAMPDGDAGWRCRMAMPDGDAGWRCRMAMPDGDAGEKECLFSMTSLRRRLELRLWLPRSYY